MTITITLENGTTVQFPDGTPEAEMLNILQQVPTEPEFDIGVGDVAREVLEGATFGFGPEAEAAIRAGVDVTKDADLTNLYAPYLPIDTSDFSKAYEKRHGEIQQRMGEFEEAHPALTTALEIGGGLATGGVGGARVLGSQAVKSLPFWARYGVAYPAVGATGGAIAGAGYADPGSRAEGAKMGAAFGGATAAGAPAVGHLVKKAVVEPIVSRLGRGGRARTAAEYGERAIRRDQMTPDEAVEEAASYGAGARLYDVGPNVRATVDVVGNRPGVGKAVLEDVLDARRAEQQGRILSRIQKYIPEGRHVKAQVEGSPEFRRALDIGIDLPPDLITTMTRPSMRKAWNAAVRIAAEDDIPLMSFNAFRKGVGSGRIVQSKTELMHYLKKGLDDVLERKRNLATGQLESQYGKNILEKMKATRRKFRERVKELNPDYAKQLSRVEVEKKLDTAYEDGTLFLTSRFKSTSDLANRIKRMSDIEHRAFLRGISDAIEEGTSGPAAAGFDITGMVNRQLPRLKIAFKDSGDALEKELKAERQMMRHDSSFRGSQTQPRQAAAADFEGGMIGDVAASVSTGNTSSITAQLLRAAANKLMGPPANVAPTLANILTSDDPAVWREFARLMKQNSAAGVPMLATLGRGSIAPLGSEPSRAQGSLPFQR